MYVIGRVYYTLETSNRCNTHKQETCLFFQKEFLMKKFHFYLGDNILMFAAVANKI